MKRQIVYLFSFVLVLSFAPIISAQTFEGVVTMDIATQTGGKNMKMTTSIKGEKSLIEMQLPQGKIKMFIDQPAGTMTMVMESMKMGMVTDLKKAQEAAKKLPQDTDPPSVQATGETKTISNYNCERFHVITQKGDTSDWWMTKDLPKSLLNSMKSAMEKGLSGGIRNQNHGAIGGAMETMFKKGMVPIRIESKQATITFASFEEKKLDDSIFVIPSDITIQPMPAGLGGGQ